MSNLLKQLHTKQHMKIYHSRIFNLKILIGPYRLYIFMFVCSFVVSQNFWIGFDQLYIVHIYARQLVLYYTIYFTFIYLTNLYLKIKKSIKERSSQKTSQFYRQTSRLFIFQIHSADPQKPSSSWKSNITYPLTRTFI